jgi:hypothetical protein
VNRFPSSPEKFPDPQSSIPEWVDSVLASADLQASCHDALLKAQTRFSRIIDLSEGSGWSEPVSAQDFEILERTVNAAKDRYWAAIPWLGAGNPEDHGLTFKVHLALVRRGGAGNVVGNSDQCAFYLECLDWAQRHVLLTGGNPPQVSRSTYGMGSTYTTLADGTLMPRMVFSEQALVDVLGQAGSWLAEYPDWVGAIVGQHPTVCRLPERDEIRIRLSNKNGFGTILSASNELLVLEFSADDAGTPNVKITSFGKI